VQFFRMDRGPPNVSGVNRMDSNAQNQGRQRCWKPVNYRSIVTGRGHPSTPINGKLPDIPTQTLDDKRVNMWQSLGNRAVRPCNTRNIPRLPPFIFHIKTCDTLQSRRRRGHPYCGRKKKKPAKEKDGPAQIRTATLNISFR
jgi:hypothetical protein